MEEKIYLQCMTLHRFTSDLITDTRTIKWHYTNESQDLSDALFEKKKKAQVFKQHRFATTLLNMLFIVHTCKLCDMNF